MSIVAGLPNGPDSHTGAPGPATPPGVSPVVAGNDEAKLKADLAQRSAAAFGGIVVVMMHSPAYQGYTLADLKWIVLPAVISGQYSLAQARVKETGDVKPVGVVLWAAVSDEVDRRLTTDPQASVRLAADEWRSGTNLWIVEGIGERTIIAGQIRRLREKEWRGRPVKIKVRSADGTPVVRQIPPT